MVPKSATLKCQSLAHNEKSPATLATIHMGYYNKSTNRFIDNYKFNHNITIINEGVVVMTLATRCDGIVECFGGKDENGCGNNNPYSITLIGILHYLYNLSSFYLLKVRKS